MTIKKTLLLSLFFPAFVACGTTDHAPDCADDCQEAGADAGLPSIETRLVTVAKVGDGDGQLLINGEPCEGFPCAREVEVDTTVTLEARPELTSSFGGWSNACASEQVCEIVADSDNTLSISFDLSGVLLEQTTLPDFRSVGSSARDVNGNTYVSGSERVSGTVESERGYCAKLDHDGAVVWKVPLEVFGGGSSLGVFVGVDAAGNPYTAVQQRLGRQSFSVIRLSPTDGSEVWRFNIPKMAFPVFAVDGPGNVFAAGNMQNDASFGSLLIAANDSDVHNMIGVITSQGGLQRAALLPESAKNIAGIRALPEGGLLLSRGREDGGLLERFNSEGEITASFETPSAGQIAQTPEGDIIVMERYRGALNWGNSPELQAPALPVDTADSALFLGRWRSDGTPVWLRTFDTTGFAFFVLLPCLEVSPAGDIFGCGSVTRGQVDLGGGLLPLFDDLDGFAFSYSSDGEFRWAESMAGNDNDVLLGGGLAESNAFSVHAVHGALTTAIGPIEPGFSLFTFQR